ncbi:uncharacterized protein [Acropora muricata]|uniref:uncharacterized protein n=1 Tax=Acropora muricata TaxID=159855 RepID=UPI0034E572D3
MSVSAEEQTRLCGHKWHISRLEFSPGGLHLASASWDKTVRIWDLSTLESIFVLRHHRNPVTCLSWQPTFGGIGVLGLLASGSADNTVALWNGETGKLRKTFSYHKGWVLGTSFSSDGSLLASASWDKSVCVVDARTGQLLHKCIGHSTGVWTCSFQTGSSSTDLLCSGADDGSLKIWDTRTGYSVASLVGAHDDSVKSCAWSPDGGYIASGATDNKIALWEPRSGTLLSKIRGHEDAVNELQFYPLVSNKSVPIIFSVGDSSCRVWHPLRKHNKQLQIIKQHKLGAEVESLALSPDGSLLATGARDKDIILSSLDVSLTEVDALPIEEQNEAAINYGATLWKKYTKKVMQKINTKTASLGDDFEAPQGNPKDTASLVGHAVHRAENKTKDNDILKEIPANSSDVSGIRESNDILKEQRARLRKSSPADIGITNELDSEGLSEGIHIDQKPKLRKSFPQSSNAVTINHIGNQYNEVHKKLVPEDGQSTKVRVNGHNSVMDINSNHSWVVVENGEVRLRGNGYQSYGESSSASSSNYCADVEDSVKDIYDYEDARF